MSWSQRLGTVGVCGANGVVLAKTIEELGYGTVWQGASPDARLRQAEELLDATECLQVATGVVNIWKSDAAELADSYHRIEAKHPGRLLLGIGSGHREATPERVRPIEAMASVPRRPRRTWCARRGPRAVRARTAHARPGGRTQCRDAPLPDDSLADGRSQEEPSAPTHSSRLSRPSSSTPTPTPHGGALARSSATTSRW